MVLILKIMVVDGCSRYLVSFRWGWDCSASNKCYQYTFSMYHINFKQMLPIYVYHVPHQLQTNVTNIRFPCITSASNKCYQYTFSMYHINLKQMLPIYVFHAPHQLQTNVANIRFPCTTSASNKCCQYTFSRSLDDKINRSSGNSDPKLRYRSINRRNLFQGKFF